MRVGELVDPDSATLRDYRKAIPRHSVEFPTSPHPHASFFLPMHKADRLWKGSTIVLEHRPGSLDPLPIFKNYISARDARFPHLPDLWLTAAGKIPTRSWFISRFHAILPSSDVAGHSLRAGGATALALAGTPLERIQIIGRWSSQAFLIYLRRNPILMQSSISGHSAFDRPRAPS